MKHYSRKHYNLTVMFAALALLALNHSVLLDLFHKWYAQDLTGPYSHGLLVALIVLYLVYKKIQDLGDRLIPDPSLAGLILLAGSAFVLFFSIISGVNFLQHIALLAVLLSIVWFAYSFNITRQFVMPAILLSLTFPVWGGVEYFLQIITIHTTSFVLSMTAVPFYRDGAFFHFSSGIIEIAPECAGYQQMLVSIIIGLLFSLQHQLRISDIIKTLLYLSIAAIVINTIRIIIIMIVGYYTKMESSLITKHLLLGWVIYGIGIYVFLYFYSGLRFKPVRALGHVSGNEHKVNFLSAHPPLVNVLLIALVMLPSATSYALTRYINSQPIQAIHVQVKSGAWRKISKMVPASWAPDFPASDSDFTGTFRNKDGVIYAYVLNYQHIKDGVEPVNMDNLPYNRGIWKLQKHELVTVKNKANGPEHANLDILISRSGERLIVLSYNVINDKAMVNLVKSKFYTLLGMLKFRYSIKVVCLAVKPAAGESTASAESRLRNFLHSIRID